MSELERMKFTGLYLLVAVVLAGAIAAGAAASPPGSNQVQGMQAAGSAVSGDPVLVGLSDGTNVQNVAGDSNGVAFVSLGLNANKDTVTPFGPTASNGSTAVQLVASSASKRVYPAKFSIENTDTVAHTVTLLSSTGPTTLHEWYMPPLTELPIDNDNGFIRTSSGDALQFKIDAAGSAASVRFSGVQVQK